MQPMRPRFQEVLPSPPADVVRRLQASEVDSDACQLSVVGCHVEVSVEDALRHTWSPQLSLEVAEHASGGSELYGHFAPNPAVWTSFLAAYGLVGCCMLFGSMLGFSQLVAGHSPWGLLSVPAGALILFGIYGASLWGQHLAADQMRELAKFLHASLAIDPTGRFKRDTVEDSVRQD